MPIASGFRWCVLGAVLTSLVAYVAASGDALLGLLSLPLVLLGWWVTSSSRGERLPRPLGWALLAAAFGYAVLAVTGNGQGLVVLCRLVAVLIVFKSFDRAKLRDHAQLLLLSVFLGLATLVTSVALVPSSLVGLGVLLVGLGVMLMQIENARIAAPHTHTESSFDAPTRSAVRDNAVLLVLGCGIVTVVVFLLIPRGLAGRGRPSIGGGVASASEVGFTDRVDLGEGGMIQGDGSVVLRVEPLREDPVYSAAAPILYLRGAVLERYSRGTWRRRLAWESDTRVVNLELSQNLRLGGESTSAVRVTHEARANGPGQLFWPAGTAVVKTSAPMDVRLDEATQTAHAAAPGRLIEYEVGFSGRLDRLPSPSSLSPPERRQIDPRVRDRAREIVQAANIQSNGPVSPAAASGAVSELQTYLRNSFTYTLDRPPVPLGEDPTGWFLENADAGHCEYFASSLVQMCWAIGLEARLVTGFLAAEYNPSTGEYVVRSNNAHAWAEVFLPESGWIRVDPTPGRELRAIHQPEPGFGLWARQMFDVVNAGWIGTVVSYDEKSQRRLFGSGLDAGGSRVANFSERVARITKQDLVRALLAGLAAAGITAAVGFGAVALFNRARRRRVTPNAWQHAATAARYRKALAIAGSMGNPKPPGTPLLRHAQATLRSRPLALAVELLYAARFGKAVLETDLVDRLLAEAEEQARSRTAEVGPRVMQRT
ncbi:MAG: transglutaminaseTgpA domain-containing protein [Planctomycetota bacterium]